ncbi:MAG: RNA 2',3'-cyclic phosphodiesterase [Betaproteobacteria bacterium]|nr:RNA 2',3'-cyclic phosphodiesterase [Betaproteobacteria bacterium]
MNDASAPPPAEQGEMPRVFFALWPPAAVADALARAAKAAQRACGGRAMGAESLHLTLAFIGPVLPERLADLRSAADGVEVPGFSLTFDRLGFWKRKGIVWAGCSEPAPELGTLADALSRRLRAAGFVLETRPFTAHMTLLRNASCRGEVPQMDAVRWPMGEFVLVRSRLGAHGARYEPLAIWRLEKTTAPDQ